MIKWISLLAMTSLAASPAIASVREAAFATSAEQQRAQTSVFVGATWRIGLDRRAGEPRGRALLALTGMTRTPSAEVRFGRGLEISGGQGGTPLVSMGGQDLGQVKAKAKLSGGTTAAIVIGVLVVAAVVAAVAISEATKCEEDCAPAGGS